jgi:hypothetical protein
VQQAIMEHGGSYTALVTDILMRPTPPGWCETSATWLLPAMQSPAPGGTGPP